jgi:hypothetical protein
MEKAKPATTAAITASTRSMRTMNIPLMGLERVVAE